MKQLWLDIGNTRLKYWITAQGEVIEHAAELHRHPQVLGRCEGQPDGHRTQDLLGVQHSAGRTHGAGLRGGGQGDDERVAQPQFRAGRVADLPFGALAARPRHLPRRCRDFLSRNPGEQADRNCRDDRRRSAPPRVRARRPHGGRSA